MKGILDQFKAKTGQIAVLIDPEKSNSEKELLPLLEKAKFAQVNYIFVGGSTVSQLEFEQTVEIIKKYSTIPVVIFPGNHQQLSRKANALLYLSLLSGRNAEYLIGQHVASAKEVMDLNMEVIPTAYLLIDGGKQSSVAYVSQTTPIPQSQSSIAIRTAIAGVLQGKQLVFFDAGSGALQTVPAHILVELKSLFPELPIIVGGGVRGVEQIQAFNEAGANVIVIGNRIEEELDFLLDIAGYMNSTR